MRHSGLIKNSAAGQEIPQHLMMRVVVTRYFTCFSLTDLVMRVEEKGRQHIMSLVDCTFKKLLPI